MSNFHHGIETVQIDDGIRPIRTAKSSVIGIVGTAASADAGLFPLDTPVLITGPRQAAGLGDEGTLKDAYLAAYAQGVNIMIVVRVDQGLDGAETRSNVIGSPLEATGLYALLNAGSVTGQVPRILAAPGFTSTPASDPVSPVTSALLTVAEKLRAVVVADGPNTNEADAITDAGKFSSDRLFIVDPAVRVWDTSTSAYETQPASGFVAGMISARDAEKGFWHSPSNQVAAGVGATSRPISFAINETETEANRLNAANVATIVRQGGFRLWGNRTTADDALWAFLPVRRTADMVYESVETALLWAMDRPFSAQLLRDIMDSIQAYIDELVARGALLGGEVWVDPELNTEASLKAGKAYLDFNLEPPAPLENLILRAHREGSYYDEMIAEISTS